MNKTSAMRLVCNMEDISEASVNRFLSMGCDLIIIRKKTKFYCYRNECPHMNLPLSIHSKGVLDKEQKHLVCAQHAAEFVIENGLCVKGPCIGMKLEPVSIELTDGNVLLKE